MEPNFRDGDYVFVLPYILTKPKKGDVVVLRKRGVLMIKRIEAERNSSVIVRGDNQKRSSRFAAKKDTIIGRVLFRIGKNQ